MRSDGEGNYKIYRDKGKKVGEFSLRRGYAKYFIKHKDKFFIMWGWESFEDDEECVHEQQTDDPESRDLYYTDLDGKNVEKIAE